MTVLLRLVPFSYQPIPLYSSEMLAANQIAGGAIMQSGRVLGY